MAARIRETTTKTTRNNNGVETTDTTTKDELIRYSPAPPFVMLMADGIDQLSMLSQSEFRVLIQLGSRMSCDGSTMIDLSQHVRKMICETLQITKKTLSNTLTSLRKRGLVLDSDDPTSSLMYVNPYYLYKGKTKLRSQKCRDFINRQCKRIPQLAS